MCHSHCCGTWICHPWCSRVREQCNVRIIFEPLQEIDKVFWSSVFIQKKAGFDVGIFIRESILQQTPCTAITLDNESTAES
jgi:hypothetical protein